MNQSNTKDALVSDAVAKKFETEKETPYTRWVAAQGLDIIDAMYIFDLHTVDLKPWARRGGRGARPDRHGGHRDRRATARTATHPPAGE